MNYNVKGINANGEKVIERLSIPQILDRYGLDFHIEKAPLLAMNDNGEQMLTPYYGLFNTASGECINTCKEGYQVSQNVEVVEMVMKGIEGYSDKLSVSKAGSLNGGRRVFMQLEIEGDSKVGDDIIKRYVTVIDSNDGSTGLSVGIGDFTMSCSNQFFRFYSKGDAKFRHTATLQQKIQTIPSLIQTALEESMKQIKVYNKFQSTEVSRDLANQMVKYILGYDKVITSVAEQSKLTSRSLGIMEDLYNNIEHEMNEKGNNLWGLHSGVTRWTTHSKPGPKRTNGHIESMLIGAGYKKNQDSLSFVSKYAGLELV
jgi:hypothetical protein